MFWFWVNELLNSLKYSSYLVEPIGTIIVEGGLDKVLFKYLVSLPIGVEFIITPTNIALVVDEEEYKTIAELSSISPSSEKPPKNDWVKKLFTFSTVGGQLIAEKVTFNSIGVTSWEVYGL